MTPPKHWNIDQWVAYLKDKEIPVLPATQAVMQVLLDQGAQGSEALSSREMTNFVYADPYLALRLLRSAELRRSSRLGTETTTALAAVMQTGMQELFASVCKSPTITIENTGWYACVSRATMAASIARTWSSMRNDVSPNEVALAALLSECGELMLWHAAPELPIHAMEELDSGRAFRNAAAQQQAVGFTFKQLTLTLAQAWELPALIAMLIRGTDSPRANIARLAVDTARHIVTDYRNPALPSDMVNIKNVIPNASYQRLITALPLSDAHKAGVLAAIAQETTITTQGGTTT